MGANAVDRKSTFLCVLKNKRALLLAVVKGLDIQVPRSHGAFRLVPRPGCLFTWAPRPQAR